jgi:hypothetical protein
MPWTRKPKPTDVPETLLDQFAGTARRVNSREESRDTPPRSAAMG